MLPAELGARQTARPEQTRLCMAASASTLQPVGTQQSTTGSALPHGSPVDLASIDDSPIKMQGQSSTRQTVGLQSGAVRPFHAGKDWLPLACEAIPGHTPHIMSWGFRQWGTVQASGQQEGQQHWQPQQPRRRRQAGGQPASQ